MTASGFLNALCLPLRLVCPHHVANRLGLKSLRDERCEMVMRHARGRLLDVGCGNNQLVRQYGHDSIGVDVHDFGGGAVIVRDASVLSFADASFGSVSFVASLNHIPNRQAVLREARRVLEDRGLLLITMLSPVVGAVRHRLAWFDVDQTQRGMKDGELMGMSPGDLVGTVEREGFGFVRRIRFVMGLNSLYIFRKGEGGIVGGEGEQVAAETGIGKESGGCA